jgi:hypothetical protein
MEKHVLPQAAIHGLMRRHGVDRLEMQEDRAVGHPDIISNTFFARKGTGQDQPLSANRVGPM